jgi:SAM-dependent methyltransferase
VALHLARNGLDVVGIDASPHMLARLRDRLDGDDAKRVRTVEGDVRDFDLGGERFDLVYCALSSFELLTKTADQLATLGCVSRHLAPGGVFVAQLRSPVHVDWSAGPSPLVLEWTRIDPATDETVTKLSSSAPLRAEQCLRYTEFFDRTDATGAVRRRVFEVALRPVGRFEIELLLAGAGLRLAHVYGDADLSPYTDDSDTMVIVAELS